VIAGSLPLGLHATCAARTVGFTVKEGSVRCGISEGIPSDPSRVYCTAKDIPWPSGLKFHFGSANAILGSSGAAQLASVSDDLYPRGEFVQLTPGRTWSGDLSPAACRPTASAAKTRRATASGSAAVPSGPSNRLASRGRLARSGAECACLSGAGSQNAKFKLERVCRVALHEDAAPRVRVSVSTAGFLFAHQQEGRGPGPGQATTTAGADTSAWFARRTVSPTELVCAPPGKRSGSTERDLRRRLGAPRPPAALCAPRPSAGRLSSCRA
jgi:hypothetical protein